VHLFEVIAEVAPGAEGGVAYGAHVVPDPTTQISNKLGLKRKFRLIFAKIQFTFKPKLFEKRIPERNISQQHEYK
jgi:hypothetical protein